MCVCTNFPASLPFVLSSRKNGLSLTLYFTGENSNLFVLPQICKHDAIACICLQRSVFVAGLKQLHGCAIYCGEQPIVKHDFRTNHLKDAVTPDEFLTGLQESPLER